jgi:hypothetical protein
MTRYVYLGNKQSLQLEGFMGSEKASLLNLSTGPLKLTMTSGHGELSLADSTSESTAMVDQLLTYFFAKKGRYLEDAIDRSVWALRFVQVLSALTSGSS